MKSDRHLIAGLALVLVLASLPWWLLTTSYAMGIVIIAMMFVALALSWNIISGIGGQLSMGHAVFFGLGAYTSTLMLVRLGITPWIGMFAGGLVAAFAGLCLGYPSFRLKGVYFKLVTFVSGLILEIGARSWIGFTGGDAGLQVPLQRNAPLMYQFASPVPYYYLILVLAVLYFLISRWILNSRFGFYLQALRDDQVAAEAMGIDCLRLKLVGFALSAFLTALAGTFYAQYMMFIDPASTFGMFVSVKIALAAIAGGAGTLWGPVIGGLFLIPVGELANWQLARVVRGVDVVFYSVVLIVIAIYLPRGLVTLPDFIRQRTASARKGGAGAFLGRRGLSVPDSKRDEGIASLRGGDQAALALGQGGGPDLPTGVTSDGHLES